jgi:hypothetical protein
LTLTAAARHRFVKLADDVRRVLGAHFVSLIATSAASSDVFADRVTAGDLDAVGALVETWHREGLSTPLLVTVDEFRRSLDTFPLEYQAMIDRHVVITGLPPFSGAVVPLDRLRDACEVQAKGHVIHLRQGWVNAAGHVEAVAELAARSAAPLRALLINVARLASAGAAGDLSPLAGARAAGLSESLIGDVLALEDAPEAGRAIVARMPEYLAASERLWAFVDEWRS